MTKYEAFIVLVFLVAIFTGKIGNFGSDVDSSIDLFKGKCVLPGTSRKCVDKEDCIPQNGARDIGVHDCVATDSNPEVATDSNPETCCEYY